jgi:hypothetical protein
MELHSRIMNYLTVRIEIVGDLWLPETCDGADCTSRQDMELQCVPVCLVPEITTQETGD